MPCWKTTAVRLLGYRGKTMPPSLGSFPFFICQIDSDYQIHVPGASHESKGAFCGPGDRFLLSGNQSAKTENWIRGTKPDTLVRSKRAAGA